MERLRGWDEGQRRLSEIPRSGSCYTTNLYASREQIERWCASGRLHMVTGDRAALLLRADRDFWHIYHVAADQPALAAILCRLPAGIFTTDLIGQGEALDEVCETYARAGFAPHTFLRRMSRIQVAGEISAGEAALATPGDVPDIAAFLDRLLDPLAEQVPGLEELEAEARAGRLLLVRRGENVAGMLLYDLKGRTAHLRFWHVDDNARGQGIGRQLLATFLARCAQAQRLVLWVIGDNERSIAIYRHYGFETDGLLDRIMVRQREQHQ